MHSGCSLNSNCATTKVQLFALGDGSGSTRAQFAPMEGDGGNQNCHQRDYDDCHGEARGAEAIPSRNRLQHAGAYKGEGYGVGADHPLAVLLEVSIARHEEGSGCGDHPCAGLNDDGCDKVEIMVFTVRVGQKNGEWSSDED